MLFVVFGLLLAVGYQSERVNVYYFILYYTFSHYPVTNTGFATSLCWHQLCGNKGRPLDVAPTSLCANGSGLLVPPATAELANRAVWYGWCGYFAVLPFCCSSLGGSSPPSVGIPTFDLARGVECQGCALCSLPIWAVGGVVWVVWVGPGGSMVLSA